MNKKPIQILVMILIAIMFIATIVITVVWKPASDIDTVSSTNPNSKTSQIINTPLSALSYSFKTNMKQF